MNPTRPRWHGSLLNAQLMALLLLVTSYLRIAGDSQSVAFSDDVLDSVFAGRVWGTTLSYNLVYFALAVLLVHVLYGIAVWTIGVLSARAWRSARSERRQHVLLWFLLLTAGVLAKNAVTFVRSSLGEPYAELMTKSFLGIPLGNALWIAVLAAAAITALTAAARWHLAGGRVTRRGYAALAAAGVAYVAVSAHAILPTHAAAPSAQPNVILIGLDSLRSDLLDEQTSPHVTPHLEAFLKEGTRFSNAMTPLARTFSSLCAMLTGRRPHQTGAVMNLLPRGLVDDRESLPRVLSRAGYHTAYATDEVRFSNIDASFGFAQTITPPIGASEFLIEKFADTPVTNMLVNTRVGGWLFPHVHGNRGVSKIYDPDVFVERIEDELAVRQPLFFNVHLALSHWPYVWADSPVRQADSGARWPPYYLDAARRVDQQLGDILALLAARGALENAIVVVYSDHGESFEAPHQALVPDGDPLVHALGIDPVWGHGTTVLSAHQYRIVLGMRHYDSSVHTGQEIAAPVSFEDIAPTLVETLGVQTSAHFDGRSLVPLIAGTAGAAQGFTGRIRFTETEYQLPPGFATQDGKVSTSKVRDALRVYDVDRVSDRITVKRSLLGKLLFNRQYAAIGEQHLIGAFPRMTAGGYDYLAIALAGGEPRQLFGEPGSDEPELRALWIALQQEFGNVLEQRLPVAAAAVAIPQRTIPSSVTK